MLRDVSSTKEKQHILNKKYAEEKNYIITHPTLPHLAHVRYLGINLYTLSTPNHKAYIIYGGSQPVNGKKHRQANDLVIRKILLHILHVAADVIYGGVAQEDLGEILHADGGQALGVAEELDLKHLCLQVVHEAAERANDMSSTTAPTGETNTSPGNPRTITQLFTVIEIQTQGYKSACKCN